MKNDHYDFSYSLIREAVQRLNDWLEANPKENANRFFQGIERLGHVWGYIQSVDSDEAGTH